MDLTGVLDGPAQMTMGERLLLFALVCGLRPRRVLEVGTCEGGSALLMRRALDPAARLVCIDPQPRWTADMQQSLGENTWLIAAPSPPAIAPAVQRAGGAIDFVLIDGDHTAAGVERDIVGVVPYLAEGAVVVLHDAHYWRVQEGIARALDVVPDLLDAGMVSVEATPAGIEEEGHLVVWGGLRMLRFTGGTLRA